MIPSALTVTSRHLALLRALNAAAPNFAIWKNAEAGLVGSGDLDAVAPADEWPRVAAEHRRWALSNELGPPLECRHVPGLLLLVAFSPDTSTALLQLDVSTHIFVQGAPLVAAAQLRSLLRMDERGFRVLRPGAEGLFKLLQSDPRSGTRQSVDPTVVELLDADLIGARRAARLLGRAGPAADRAARAVIAGGWDRSAMAEVRGWCLLAAARRPLLPARRVVAGLGPVRGCPLIAALAGGRRVPGRRDVWLARVAATHRLRGTV